MQNFIITLVLFLLSLFVSAQEAPENFKLEKGTLSKGGAFSVDPSERIDKYVESIRGYDNFFFNIRPAVGYFLVDNLELDAEIGYGSSKRNFNESSVQVYRRNSCMLFLNTILDFSTSRNDDYSYFDRGTQQRLES